MINKRSLIFRTFMASLFLVAFTAVSLRLSGTRPESDWIVFAPPTALLLFELVGIFRYFQKENENLDKLVRLVFQMNLALMVSAEILFMLRA